MIKIMKANGNGDMIELLLFSDTKAEVPTTGTETASLIDGWGDTGAMPIGANIYTPQFDIGTLNSSDEWEWI